MVHTHNGVSFCRYCCPIDKQYPYTIRTPRGAYHLVENDIYKLHDNSRRYTAVTVSRTCREYDEEHYYLGAHPFARRSNRSNDYKSRERYRTVVLLSIDISPCRVRTTRTINRRDDRFHVGRLLHVRQRVHDGGRIHGVSVRRPPEDQQPSKGKYVMLF